MNNRDEKLSIIISLSQPAEEINCYKATSKTTVGPKETRQQLQGNNFCPSQKSHQILQFKFTSTMMEFGWRWTTQISTQIRVRGG
jgi:hypothetical protein